MNFVNLRQSSRYSNSKVDSGVEMARAGSKRKVIVRDSTMSSTITSITQAEGVNSPGNMFDVWLRNRYLENHGHF